VAYDEDLADRIRELVASEAGVTERKMFGGLAFLRSLFTIECRPPKLVPTCWSAVL
jgi:hypothetical protein